MTVRHPTSVGVVGGGIVGLAVARRLSIVYPGVAITVFEKEDTFKMRLFGRICGCLI